MCLFIETISVRKRQFENLSYHQQRFDATRREQLGLTESVRLEDVAIMPQDIGEAVYKCRIVYSKVIHAVEFVKYEKKLPESIKLVFDDEIDYGYKFENREALQQLKKTSGADEIIIVKQGMVTDTSYSNIVLSKGTLLITPSTFLLNGTKRRKLLENGRICEREVTVDDLYLCKTFYLINAMLDLEDQPGFPVAMIQR